MERIAENIAYSKAFIDVCTLLSVVSTDRECYMDFENSGTLCTLSEWNEFSMYKKIC